MDALPKRTADRVIGESYLHNGEVRIWDGKLLKCKHNRQRHKCKDCGGSQICEHGRQKSNCRDCGGSQICEHGRRRVQCKDCDGSQICEHGRQKSTCKDCGGTSICEHGRIRNTCKDCDGGSFCEHGCRRSRCNVCDPHGHIKHLISTRIHHALINERRLKSKSTLELLGCTIKEARVYIENQFSDRMSWENAGDWHIDHRRPCASFDLTLESEQKKCFHYTNLQPLWGYENLSKGSSFDEDSFDWEWDGSKWVEKK